MRRGLLLSGLMLATATATATATALAATGEDLYLGRTAIPAQLRGDTLVLPAAAARCANCHEASAGRTLAPRLDAATLTRPKARRGGPPSRYDEATFCRVLRSGVDPAWVLLRREMPQFDADDTQCAALWRHLSARAPLGGPAE